MIAPQTHFDLQLPVSTWQGRYLQNGCGGYCGTVSGQTFPSCDATLRGDFAMATDDEGHITAAGLGGGGLFAFNDQKLRDEYGYESEQALYEVSRQIIKDYYGVYPDESYYNGCSDGGREAMEMAERYPDDFNGIIAGAPEIIAGPLNAENQTWDVRVNTDAQGNAILTDDKLPALHAAVIAGCGHDDGTNDGIITDPQDCSQHLNQILQSVQCPETTYTPCLTPAQVTVAREIYDGPSDPGGRLLYPGGMPLGSEMGWSVFELPPSPNGGEVPTTESLDYFGLSQPYLRYQLNRPGQLGPDPSVYHCGGGYANAVTPDLIYPMVQWAEDGTAPRQLAISYTVGSSSFSRPVYPYPYIPQYNGSGDQSSAASFHPVVAPAAARGTDYTNWYGNYLFYQPIGGGGRDQGYASRG